MGDNNIIKQKIDWEDAAVAILCFLTYSAITIIAGYFGDIIVTGSLGVFTGLSLARIIYVFAN